MRFPLREAILHRVPMPARSPESHAAAKARSKKVLLVADPATTERHRSRLAGAGLRVFEAESAVLGMEVHRRERVDLIACDLDVSGGGIEGFIAAVRTDEELRHVAVVVLCGDEEADLQRAASCRANTVLARSIVDEQLLAVIVRLLSVPDRASYRVLLSVVRYGEAQGRNAFFANSHDISTAGLLLETSKPVEKGDRVSCSFFLPGGRRVAGDGEVVRIASRSDPERKYGVKWLHLAPEALEAIDIFVKERNTKHGRST
jgi:CheY-like chemotaxis protein